MSDEINTTTLASIDVLVSYKNGSLNLDEAVSQFCYFTGLEKNIGTKFIEEMSRNNIIDFHLKSRGVTK